MRSRKLKLISDGDPVNTKLIDVKSGEMIGRVTEIHFTIGANSWGEMTIKLSKPDVEIEGFFTPCSKDDNITAGGVFFDSLEWVDGPR